MADQKGRLVIGCPEARIPVVKFTHQGVPLITASVTQAANPVSVCATVELSASGS